MGRVREIMTDIMKDWDFSFMLNWKNKHCHSGFPG